MTRAGADRATSPSCATRARTTSSITPTMPTTTAGRRCALRRWAGPKTTGRPRSYRLGDGLSNSGENIDATGFARTAGRLAAEFDHAVDTDTAGATAAGSI